MRVLLSFENFADFGGTETYTLTVARELERLGHEVAIYSPNHGEMADFARRQGIAVIGRNELSRAADLLISQDAATCHELARHCQDAARIFVAHSADFRQAPPQLPDRCAAVVVMNERVRRAVAGRGWHAPIVRLRQPIDLTRFEGLDSDTDSRTALVMTNYVKGARAELIENACRANGLDVRWIGATSERTSSPELAIAGAKIVIGLGRCVLEGMAATRATYVYGVIGGDGWVTPERYPAMEADGFAGTSAPDVVIDGARLADDLAGWDEVMGQVNRDLAAAHHSAREHAIELVKLARGLEASRPPDPSLADELAHLVRLQWQTDIRANESAAEVEDLRTQLAEAEANVKQMEEANVKQMEEAAEVEDLRTQLAEAEANLSETEANLSEAEANLSEAEANLKQMEEAAKASSERLEALSNTRRYRLACRVAAPLDRMRARLGITR